MPRMMMEKSPMMMMKPAPAPQDEKEYFGERLYEKIEKMSNE